MSSSGWGRVVGGAGETGRRGTGGGDLDGQVGQARNGWMRAGWISRLVLGCIVRKWYGTFRGVESVGAGTARGGRVGRFVLERVEPIRLVAVDGGESLRNGRIRFGLGSRQGSVAAW